ncbi:MAG: DUF4157 domain-containing protein [Planctomycetota bacterium]
MRFPQRSKPSNAKTTTTKVNSRRQTLLQRAPASTSGQQPHSDISFELQDAPQAETAEARALAWIRQNRATILAEARSREIDPRSIAGTIVWEAAHNIQSTLQGTAFQTSVGPGKVHLYERKMGRLNPFGNTDNTIAKQVEEEGLLPRRSFKERKSQLQSTAGSIRYIAAIMRALSDTASRHGYFINQDPSLLGSIYQQFKLDTWEAHLSQKKKGSPLTSANPIGLWIESHLDQLDAALDLAKSRIDPARLKKIIKDQKFQPKLIVNTSGDKYEREADRVAEQVMRMPEPSLQRQCSCGKSASNGECEECKKKKQPASGTIQRKSASAEGGIAAPPIVNDVIGSSGSPLPTSTRSFMETRFGQDFSHVRVHTDHRAAESAAAVQARAYTVGNNIVFGKGETPTADGRLLAHELTHVVQQGDAQSDAFNTIQRWEGYEHIQLGDEVSNERFILQFHKDDLPGYAKFDDSWPETWKVRWNTATPRQRNFLNKGLSYGELNALSGDFYGSFEELNRASLLEVFRLVEMIHDRTTTDREFNVATGGRFLRLANNNSPHFTNFKENEDKPISGNDKGKKNNLETWRENHKKAIDEARNGNREVALEINGFADHFLQDAFAAGHIRAVRTVNPGLIDNFKDRSRHNLDNNSGVRVTVQGKLFNSYGDNNLEKLQKRGEDTYYRKILEALRLSKHDIEEAFAKRKRYPAPEDNTKYLAEKLIPQAVNPAEPELNTLEGVREGLNVVSEGAKVALDMYLNDDTIVLDWLRTKTDDEIKRQPQIEKKSWVDSLTSGWCTEEEESAAQRVCNNATPPNDELQTERNDQKERDDVCKSLTQLRTMRREHRERSRERSMDRR